MQKNPERNTPPLTPEEIALYCGGGKKYGVEALAQKAVGGEIPAGQIRRIIGVDEEGNPIYAPHSRQEGPSFTFRGSLGEKHRQSPRRRK